MRRGDELHPLPEGLTGMIPTNLEALDESALLSAEGKARFAAEVDVPPARGDAGRVDRVASSRAASAARRTTRSSSRS